MEDAMYAGDTTADGRMLEGRPYVRDKMLHGKVVVLIHGRQVQGDPDGDRDTSTTLNLTPHEARELAVRLINAARPSGSLGYVQVIEPEPIGSFHRHPISDIAVQPNDGPLVVTANDSLRLHIIRQTKRKIREAMGILD